MNSYKNIFKWIIVLSLIVLVVIMYNYYNIADIFNISSIRNLLERSGNFAPVIYILMMTTAVVISPLPSLPLNIVAGMFFGPLQGTVYSVTGALIGAVTGFLIARFLGQEVLMRFFKDKSHMIICPKCSNKLITKIVFFSRLVPFVSFDIVSYGAGLTNISLKSFSIATAFGMIPLTFIYNYFGSTITSGGWITVALGMIMVILFFLVPVLIEKYNIFSLKKYFDQKEIDPEN